MATAEEHGVSLLVLESLKAAKVPMPAMLAEDHEATLIETTAANLSRTTQLADLQQKLALAGVPSLGIKGPVLAALAYGHVGLRPFSDLDILVCPESIDNARRVMIGSGYRFARRDFHFDSSVPARGREDGYAPKQRRLSPVEVKSSIGTWPLSVDLPPATLIERGVVVNVGGRPILTLSREDLVLVLAINGIRHSWRQLRLVSDIDAVAHLDLDWEAVVTRARNASMTRMLSVALLLARELLETPIPSVPLAIIERDRTAIRLVRSFSRSLFEAIHSRIIYYRRHWLEAQSRERWEDRLRYARRMVVLKLSPALYIARRKADRQSAALG